MIVARLWSCSAPATISLADAEPDPWVHDLLEASPGRNLGVDFLPGALTWNPAADARPDPDFAADVLWFDSLVTNTDRSPRNPNLLAWHRRSWLIDHGARMDAVNRQGMTPLNIAEGIHLAALYKVRPQTAALLRDLMSKPR